MSTTERIVYIVSGLMVMATDIIVFIEFYKSQPKYDDQNKMQTEESKVKKIGKRK